MVFKRVSWSSEAHRRIGPRFTVTFECGVWGSDWRKCWDGGCPRLDCPSTQDAAFLSGRHRCPHEGPAQRDVIRAFEMRSACGAPTPRTRSGTTPAYRGGRLGASARDTALLQLRIGGLTRIRSWHHTVMSRIILTLAPRNINNFSSSLSAGGSRSGTCL